MANPTAAPEGLLTIQHPGGQVPLAFPDSGNIRDHLTAVLSGREYPILRLPGYEPQVIVDIDANVGGSAIFFHLSYPAARVLCYEPSPTNVAYLRRNLGNRANVEMFAYGLSDRSERVRLFIGRNQTMQNSVVRSVETSDAYEEAEVRRASDEWTARGFSHVGILKVDTEGCEVPILHDLRPHLANVDFVYFEYHSDDDRRTIDALLAEWFVLAHGRSPGLHRGTMMYLARRLLERFPALDAAKIVRS